MRPLQSLPRLARVILEQFSVIVVTDGGFGAGLDVATAKLGWQQVSECAVRRGTRSGAVMRDTVEFRENANFRRWLHEEFEHDIEVFEYAKALAQWQFDSLVETTPATPTADQFQTH